MKKILPIILLILGVAGGGVAGVFLKPPEEPPEEDGQAKDEARHAATRENSDSEDLTEGEAPTNRAFVKVGRQTIVPVLDGGETRALMLFELAVDVPAASANIVHEMEPRLRDAFLRELFQMSYTGAFLTEFTDDRVIEELRRNLTRAARQYVGEDAREVLILDVMRQEM
ncbi:MAG: flagellar basal body-associated FliL family protein [Paracoccaceae bacterium]